MFWRLFVLIVIFTGGCASLTPRAPIPACATPPTTAESWDLVDEGYFSLRIPPGFNEVPVQPLDSHVRQWEAGSLRIIKFDAGLYSSPLRELRDLRGYSECRFSIDGVGTLLVSGWDHYSRILVRDRKYVVAATWRDISPGAHLTIIGVTPTASEQATLMAVMRSVRFKRSD